MKKVFFVCASNVYGNDAKNIYIPYSAGCIKAFVSQNETVLSNYSIAPILYQKQPIEDMMRRMEDPFIVLFSCYVWNFEFNKALAEAVKKKYPSCIIVFGGHSISSDATTLRAFPFIDILTHQFGEESTLALLLHFVGGGNLRDIANISYREGADCVTTQTQEQTGSDYPSPYLSGAFDDILSDDIHFSAIFETNRGCPNKCSFCDWSSLKSKVRLFPMERVKAEIDWFAEHKIEYIYCADGNFCMFPRDEEIADYIIDRKKKYGYPQIFNVNFTKNKLDFIFRMGKKFYEAGLNKAQTVSFQSMNEATLAMINRKNISPAVFVELLKRYADAGIPTYSELILGLPGETRESFVRGVSMLLDCGQHFAMNIYPCEHLPNSEMGQPDYIEKHKIRAVAVPFSMAHTMVCEDGIVGEKNNYVVSTSTMGVEDWIASLTFSTSVLAWHIFGLLRSIAVYLHYENGEQYGDFYSGLLEYAEQSSGFLHDICTATHTLCADLAGGRSGNATTCSETGAMLWSFEEKLFLDCYANLDLFYEDVWAYLVQRFGESELLRDLLTYQKSIIKKIGVTNMRVDLQYDFFSYFNRIYKFDYAPLQERSCTLILHDDTPVSDFSEFAREVVWYGRQKKASDYTAGKYSCKVVDHE